MNVSHFGVREDPVCVGRRACKGASAPGESPGEYKSEVPRIRNKNAHSPRWRK